MSEIKSSFYSSNFYVRSPTSRHPGNMQEVSDVLPMHRRTGAHHTRQELSEGHPRRLPAGQRRSVEHSRTTLGVYRTARQGVPASDASGLCGAGLSQTGSSVHGNGQCEIIRGVIGKNQRAAHVPLHSRFYAAAAVRGQGRIYYTPVDEWRRDSGYVLRCCATRYGCGD